jgi:hypothetical protein
MATVWRGVLNEPGSSGVNLVQLKRVMGAYHVPSAIEVLKISGVRTSNSAPLVGMAFAPTARKAKTSESNGNHIVVAVKERSEGCVALRRGTRSRRGTASDHRLFSLGPRSQREAMQSYSRIDR